MKKVGKYVAITLLMLLGLFCVGILYLFFIPNSSLFNITYINNNEVIKSKKYSTDAVSEINLNSRSYELNVMSTDDDKISIEVSSHSFGFVHKKNEKVKISSSLSNNILTFNVAEPYGLTANSSSSINLFLPTSKIFDLNLKNKKSETSISDKNLSLNNFSYTTISGNLNLNKVTITGKMKLNLNESECFIDSSVETNFNNIDLKLTSGKFIATKSQFGDITILKNSRGIINVDQCNTVRENISDAGGQINVNKISHINVKASDTIISLGKVENGAIIDLVGSGKTTIGTLKGVSSISTNSGKIKINNCLSSATLHTDDGNITVKKAMKTISTKTNYGEINIAFSDDADHYSESDTDKSRTLFAEIKNGKLTATGVEHVGSSNFDSNQGIIVTGNGRVNLTMNDVCGENLIKGKNGNVKIVINHESIYKLTTNPNKKTQGNVRVNLMQISQYKGYTNKGKKDTYVNCTETTYGTNQLIASTTTGDLTILDTKVN